MPIEPVLMMRPPCLARDHPLARFPRHEKRPAQIGAHDRVEIFDGEIGDEAADVHAGVVDEDVDRPEGFFDFVKGRRDARSIRHVEHDRGTDTTLRLDFFFYFGETIGPAPGDGDFRACTRQHMRKMPAQTTCRARDESRTSLQIKFHVR